MDYKPGYSKGVIERKLAALNDSELDKVIKRGQMRAQTYGKEWEEVDISEIVNKFAPGTEPVLENGKIKYTSKDGVYSVVADVGGGYLRIQKNLGTKKYQYLNLDGTDGHNFKDEKGKTHGKSKDLYQKTTHFKIKKRSKK